MDNLYLSQAYNMVDEFIKLYNIDEYIPKSKIDIFFDKYSDIIELSKKYQIQNDEKYTKYLSIIKNGYLMINVKNNNYIEKHLETEKSYFDNMFKDVDPNIILDNNQRKAILIDEDYSLVIAGAGSGKTTTMVAKVKYLIEKKHINPKSIILLSFTNSSVEDLDDMVNNKFKLGVEVLTFHKLGMKFLREIADSKLKIVADEGTYKIISDYFLNVVFKDKTLLCKYMRIFNNYLFLEEESLKYENYDKYYEYFMNRKYDECKDNLDKEIQFRIKNREKIFETINGEMVKSNGEVQIANYLYKHGIDYQYENLYPFFVDGRRSYEPDFTIDDFGKKIYIEYFGLAVQRKDESTFSENKNYLKEIYKKRETHKKNYTDLLELYGRYENGNYYILDLKTKLLKRNVLFKKRTNEEIFRRLLETGKSYKYMNLIRLFMIFIQIFKENNYSLFDFDLLIKICENSVLKEQIECIKDVYIYYENELHKQKGLDFEDMIHKAYLNMEKIKNLRKNLNYNYVIIDEYQDISHQRFDFAKKISDVFNSKIVAVGDDWQSIYSFSGSDMELFTRFREIMGYSANIKITKTYRNCQELIDVAGDFVLRDTMHIDKQLISDKHLKNPIKLVEYQYAASSKTIIDEKKDLPHILNDLIISIYNEYPNDNILLLERFNSEISILIDSKLFYIPYATKNSIICKAVPNANIDYLTVHKSKGLGYDRVILLNGIDDTYGFPSKIEDEPIIDFIRNFNKETKITNVMFPEERRLFYVALTRTKNELYIMIPDNVKYKSVFIDEIENYGNYETLNIDN